MFDESCNIYRAHGVLVPASEDTFQLVVERLDPRLEQQADSLL